jgi:hypothetical protein
VSVRLFWSPPARGSVIERRHVGAREARCRGVRTLRRGGYCGKLGRAIEGGSKIMSDPMSELFGKVGGAAEMRQIFEELAAKA